MGTHNTTVSLITLFDASPRDGRFECNSRQTKEQRTKCLKTFKLLLAMMIHGYSLAMGAGISALVMVIVFIGFDGMSSTSTELKIEPAPEIQPVQDSPQITRETFVDNGSPILGDPNAPVTLIEFGDYQCHFCNVFFHSTEDKILKNYVETGKVKMIFKDYNIIGPDSINASHGAHCAEDQGMFWEYHDTLYTNWTGENNGWASSENLGLFAQEIGLDMDMWTECMLNEVHSQRILASNNDAKSLKLTGTPAFFVMGPDADITRLFGAQPIEAFEKIFDAELEK